MSKTIDTFELSPQTEEIIRSCRINNNMESLSIGYTVGRLAEKSIPRIISPIIADEFSIICYKLGDYTRTFDYIAEALKHNIWNESDCDRMRCMMSMASKYLINRYIDYNPDIVANMFSQLSKKRMSGDNKKITVTMTMCKRYDLFRKTVSSFLNCCEDIHLIDEWIVVDDNSDNIDRNKAILEFPFIKFVWKGLDDKGHPRSMNIIKNLVQTPYLFHIEDDWIFFRKEKYISICLDIIESDPSYGQCLLNRSYGEREICYDILCPNPMKFSADNNRYYEHTYYNGVEMENFIKSNVGKNCVYWPHYSLRVGLTKKEVFDRVGNFNENVGHFEMEYANRYVSIGYKTVFMDNIYCYHSGRCTFERGTELKNAYELNDEHQFELSNEKKKDIVTQDKKDIVTQYKKDIVTEDKKDIGLYLTEEEKKIPLYKIDEGEEGEDEKKEDEKKEEPVKYAAKTYVVNMEKRVDRLKKFIIDNHEALECFQYIPFKAIDGQTINPFPKTLKLFETGDYTYRKGIVGCASSHIKIWHELIVSPEMDIMIVFEDDITLTPRFSEKLCSALQKCPKNGWDILFLGHFLYPHLRRESDREDKFPEVTQWTRQECMDKSMGGTIGYIINKRGAIKMFKHIQEKGIYNAIDWVMFKNADNANIFYCYPHLVFSECVTDVIKTDSDIQYDKSSLCENDEKRLELELEYWKNKGITPLISSDDPLPSRDELLSHVHFIKTEKYLDVIKSLQFYPLEFYTLKGKYIVSIPHTKLDKNVLHEVVLDGSYINVNNPV